MPSAASGSSMLQAIASPASAYAPASPLLDLLRRTRACPARPRRGLLPRSLSRERRAPRRRAPSAGTTRLTRPQASAVARVDQLAGQQHLHRALARRRCAPRRPPGVEQNTPTLMPGSANRARVGRHRQVAHRHELAAGRRRDAVHARDHRLRQLRQLQHHPAARVEQLALPVVVGVRAHLLQVVARRRTRGRRRPARRRARARRRRRASSAASQRRDHRAVDSALKRSPRFSVSVQTPSASSVRTKGTWTDRWWRSSANSWVAWTAHRRCSAGLDRMRYCDGRNVACARPRS